MRARLRWTAGSLQGQVVTSDGSTISIGRDASCTIPLDPAVDGRASGRHCELVEEHGRALLRDLGSLNGTTLDGRPVQGAAPLAAGALVQLGGDKGPAFVVEALEVGPAPAPAAPPARAVGAATLERVVGQAASDLRAEGSRRARRALVGGAAVAVVALGAGAAAAGRLGALEREQARTGGELLALDARVEKVWRFAGALEVRVAASEAELRTSLARLGRLVNERAREADDLADQLGRLGADARDERARVEARLAAARVELADMRDNQAAYEARNEAALRRAFAPFAAVMERSRHAVYSVLVAGDGGLRFMATAFAIHPRGLLGTNGHVSQPVAAALAAGQRVVVRCNASPAHEYSVTAAWTHPVYERAEARAPGSGTRAPDVGLLEVDLAGRPLPAWLPRPSPGRLAGLTLAEPVATLGFPGVYSDHFERADGGANVAKLAPGVVSALTGFGGGAVGAASFDLVEHTCPIEPGNSGGPLLAADGAVVALVNAAEARVFATAQGKERLRVGVVAYAVSARFLADLARERFGDDGWRP